MVPLWLFELWIFLNLELLAVFKALSRMDRLSMLVPGPIAAEITLPFGSTVILITILPSSFSSYSGFGKPPSPAAGRPPRLKDTLVPPEPSVDRESVLPKGLP